MGIPAISFAKDVDVVSTVQSCVVDFQVNENFVQFEARSTKVGEPYGRGVGNLIMNMNIALPNYYPANKPYSYVITDNDLISGDGQYRISMYAKNTDGVWSDAVAFSWDTVGQGWEQGTWV